MNRLRCVLVAWFMGPGVISSGHSLSLRPMWHALAEKYNCFTRGRYVGSGDLEPVHLSGQPGNSCGAHVADLHIEHRALISIDGISVEPWHAAYAFHLSLFFLPTVAHVPVTSIRVGADHLEPRTDAGVIQQSMGHPSRQDDDVPGLDDGLNSPRVLFSPETKPCASGADTEDFMRVAVEVAGGVH